MWCNNCDQLTCSTNTTYRVTKTGKNIVIQHCDQCKVTIESELVKGTTVKIINKKKNS